MGKIRLEKQQKRRPEIIKSGTVGDMDDTNPFKQLKDRIKTDVITRSTGVEVRQRTPKNVSVLFVDEPCIG